VSVHPTPSTATSSRIPVDLRRLPGARRLATDYAFDFSAVASFFSADPSTPASWSDAIARTQAQLRQRSAVADVIAAQQQRRGTPRRAVDTARLLADSRTVAVVTGQQASLFGGPLYTLLKAITALQLAERLTKDHGVPTVAVFWVESEDHDWDEVRSSTVLDPDAAPRVVALPSRHGEPCPVASIRLDSTITVALDELQAALPPTEFSDELLAGLRRAYTPGAGMADAFAQWLERVLGDRGLIVYDASDPAAKPLASPVFVRELSTPGVTGLLAARAGTDLSTRGYRAQAQANDDSVSLFYFDATSGARRPIHREEGQFAAGDERFPPAVFADEAAHRPERFSPNVLLRPIVQDTIFPTVSYVAGPNELAYLAQLRGVYEHFGVPMPIMFPRGTAKCS
jgi:bacillithiol biosynthesis cysteine-adding enzyme BshC